MNELERKLPALPLDLKKEILEQGLRKSFPSGTEILRQGQYVKVIPLVLEGVLKVMSSYEEKDLLLYYIHPEESCIMSFSAGLWNLPSKVYAIAEEDTELILLPVEAMQEWVRKFPLLNDLFFKLYNKRYDDLLQTINQVLFNKMDKRVMDYLRERSEISGAINLDLRHHQIARDLGTAREVVSRVLKKLEADGQVKQHPHFIEIL